ncbi:MAG: hypothetical protein WDZ52_11545 [Pseudohongiellaceae bacterium]
MPALNDLLLFTSAAFIMNLSPGPSNFYVMARTLSQGTSAGLAAVLGLATGSLLPSLQTKSCRQTVADKTATLIRTNQRIRSK